MLIVKEWEVLAEESLDALLHPGVSTAADESLLGIGDASITWRGDGKYLATVNISAGKSPLANPHWSLVLKLPAIPHTQLH